MEERTPVISFKDADILNGETTVIYDLDMKVFPGDFVYIVGKVGTGKTSIIRTIIAENPLMKGEGKVCGYDLRSIKDKQIPFLRRKMGVVFQDFQLLMDRSVDENLEFVLRATGWKDRETIRERIREVLEAVGMGHKAHKMSHQLSGGEQQRIAIARALLNRPQVILADEPTGNLDPETADGIMQLICRINREEGTAVVMVTHNLNICEKYKGRMMVCSGEGCREKIETGDDGCEVAEDKAAGEVVNVAEGKVSEASEAVEVGEGKVSEAGQEAEGKVAGEGKVSETGQEAEGKVAGEETKQEGEDGNK